MTIKAYAAMTKGARLEPFEYSPASLGPLDVEVRVTHCGLCHSDVHLIDNDWGISSYPLVPGHEIVGIVTAKGSQVRHLAVGQRVGVGWQRSSCLLCDQCLAGDENLCREHSATCVGNYGGFADGITTDGRFVFPIPEGLSAEQAAPLLCGGITVFSPLEHFEVEPAMKVGIVGIGGLGHLALQFASAFGCEVTAFSSSPNKEAEARQFGAKHFVSSVGKSFGAARTGYFDFILSTVFADLDWSAYLGLIKPNGKLCFVGVPKSPIALPVFSLIEGRKSVCGSPIGGRATMRRMLEFAARHNIKASAEVMPFSRINEGVDRLRSGRSQFRIVFCHGK